MSAPASRHPMRRGPVVAGLIVLALLLGIALATLPFSLRWYDAQSLTGAVRHAPTAAPVVAFDQVEQGPVGEATRLAYDAFSWFGHDDLGRSVFYRVWPGFLISLIIGLSAAMVATVVGTSWGMVAGISGGRVDRAMMRVVDVLYGLPYILMVILLKIGLTEPLTRLLGGRSQAAELMILLVAIGGVSWLTMARVVRGQVLSLKEQAYVEAARASGASTWHLLRAHMLPNLVGPVLTYATLVIPQAILQESFLSFLGIGVQPPMPSLGRLAADGVEAVNTFVGYWWLIVFPCGVLVAALLALNFIGDGLRDAYDPKSTQATLV